MVGKTSCLIIITPSAICEMYLLKFRNSQTQINSVNRETNMEALFIFSLFYLRFSFRFLYERSKRYQQIEEIRQKYFIKDRNHSNVLIITKLQRFHQVGI